MIINWSALFKAMNLTRGSYLAIQIRYALKGASVLTNEELDKVIDCIKKEVGLVVLKLESLKKKEEVV